MDILAFLYMYGYTSYSIIKRIEFIRDYSVSTVERSVKYLLYNKLINQKFVIVDNKKDRIFGLMAKSKIPLCIEKLAPQRFLSGSLKHINHKIAIQSVCLQLQEANWSDIIPGDLGNKLEANIYLNDEFVLDNRINIDYR